MKSLSDLNYFIPIPNALCLIAILNCTDKELHYVGISDKKVHTLRPIEKILNGECIKTSNLMKKIGVGWMLQENVETLPNKTDGTIKILKGSYTMRSSEDHSILLTWKVLRSINMESEEVQYRGYEPVPECSTIVSFSAETIEQLIGQIGCRWESIKALTDQSLGRYEGLTTHLINCSSNTYYTILGNRIVPVPRLDQFGFRVIDGYGREFAHDEKRQKQSLARWEKIILRQFNIDKSNIDTENNDLIMYMVHTAKFPRRPNYIEIIPEEEINHKQMFLIEKDRPANKYFESIGNPIILNGLDMILFRNEENARTFMKTFGSTRNFFVDAYGMKTKYFYDSKVETIAKNRLIGVERNRSSRSIQFVDEFFDNMTKEGAKMITKKISKSKFFGGIGILGGITGDINNFTKGEGSTAGATTFQHGFLSSEDVKCGSELAEFIVEEERKNYFYKVNKNREDVLNRKFDKDKKVLFNPFNMAKWKLIYNKDDVKFIRDAFYYKDDPRYIDNSRRVKELDDKIWTTFKLIMSEPLLFRQFIARWVKGCKIVIKQFTINTQVGKKKNGSYNSIDANFEGSYKMFNDKVKEKFEYIKKVQSTLNALEKEHLELLEKFEKEESKELGNEVRNATDRIIKVYIKYRKIINSFMVFDKISASSIIHSYRVTPVGSALDERYFDIDYVNDLSSFECVGDIKLSIPFPELEDKDGRYYIGVPKNQDFIDENANIFGYTVDVNRIKKLREDFTDESSDFYRIANSNPDIYSFVYFHDIVLGNYKMNCIKNRKPIRFTKHNEFSVEKFDEKQLKYLYGDGCTYSPVAYKAFYNIRNLRDKALIEAPYFFNILRKKKLSIDNTLIKRSKEELHVGDEKHIIFSPMSELLASLSLEEVAYYLNAYYLYSAYLTPHMEHTVDIFKNLPASWWTNPKYMDEYKATGIDSEILNRYIESDKEVIGVTILEEIKTNEEFKNYYKELMVNIDDLKVPNLLVELGFTEEDIEAMTVHPAITINRNDDGSVEKIIHTDPSVKDPERGEIRQEDIEALGKQIVEGEYDERDDYELLDDPATHARLEKKHLKKKMREVKDKYRKAGRYDKLREGYTGGVIDGVKDKCEDVKDGFQSIFDTMCAEPVVTTTIITTAAAGAGVGYYYWKKARKAAQAAKTAHALFKGVKLLNKCGKTAINIGKIASNPIYAAKSIYDFLR